MMALGLIETRGLVASIEAADAMLKAADVRLMERHLVGGGIVTVTISGEVSAVQASIDAAVTSVGRIAGATLLSSHVIARPDDELTQILILESEPGRKTSAVEQIVSAPAAPAPEQAEDVSGEAAEPELTSAQLKNMSVHRLRELARQTAGFPMNGEQIATADRKALLAGLLSAFKKTEE